MKLFIGIPTFNRLTSLKELVSRIRSLTVADYELAVADDGSTDGTVEWCKENGIRVFSDSKNQGVNRMKNALLFYFMEHTKCEQAILLEDDCRVWEKAWESEWIVAARNWDHINWPIAPSNNYYKHGKNSAMSPWRTNWFGGQCTITTRHALSKVGYLDPRFNGYGGGHAEWTWRFYRLLKNQWGEPCQEPSVPCMSVHVGAVFGKGSTESSGGSTFSISDEDKKMKLRKNSELLDMLVHNENEPIYRSPWLTDEDRLPFLAYVKEGADATWVLAEDVQIIAGQRCPMCRGLGNQIGIKNEVPIRVCCGNTLAWAWNTEEEYLALYTDDDKYHICQQEAEGQSNYWSRDEDLYKASLARLGFIRLLRQDAVSLADVGTGTGAFLQAAKENGFEPIGFDPNKKICEEAAARGRPMRCGGWSHLVATYDVITMFDVFEHLTRPKEALQFVVSKLNPGGLLVIEMPESGCQDNIREGVNWKHIRPHQHVCIWSEASFVRLAKMCGARVEMMQRPFSGKLGKVSFYLHKD